LAAATPAKTSIAPSSDGWPPWASWPITSTKLALEPDVTRSDGTVRNQPSVSQLELGCVVSPFVHSSRQTKQHNEGILRWAIFGT
jgi:hypothetical protein